MRSTYEKKRLTHLRANTYKDEDIVTLMEDGSVRSWDAVLQTIRNFRMLWGRMKTQNQKCKVVWHANMASMSVMVEKRKGVETS